MPAPINSIFSEKSTPPTFSQSHICALGEDDVEAAELTEVATDMEDVRSSADFTEHDVSRFRTVFSKAIVMLSELTLPGSYRRR